MAYCCHLATRGTSSLSQIRKSNHRVSLDELKVSRTMFQSPSDWPFDDKSDPMAGWSITEVHGTPWAASRDTYGMLFAYLCKELQGFLHRIATLSIRFQLFNVDAKILPQLLTPGLYDRIEVKTLI
jgi:hypothetical protein